MDELNTTEQEMNDILTADETPEVGRRYKTDSKTRKARREYMAQWRESKKEEKGESQEAQDEYNQARAELYALFEDQPCHIATELETMLASARRFAERFRAEKNMVFDVQLLNLA